jgi:hypothetical protein
LKDSFATHSLTSAAKAADGEKGLIAALKRCATQMRHPNAPPKIMSKYRLFPQTVKRCGTQNLASRTNNANYLFVDELVARVECRQPELHFVS